MRTYDCFILMILFLFFVIPTWAGDRDVQVVKIWDKAPHNAFTDLIRFEGKFYCAFREGTGHVPGETGEDGKIRVLVSADGMKWESLALLAREDYDLRDPKLSCTRDQKLMLLYGGSIYDGKKLMGCQTHVSFLDKNGKVFSTPKPVVIDKKIRSDFDWLWSVSWFEGKGYGVVYQKNAENGGTVFLVSTKNGISYSLVSELSSGGFPNEATVLVKPDREMLVLLRREKGDQHGYLGYSKPPYRNWTWNDLGIRLGGPNLIAYDTTRFIMGSRSYYSEGARTALWLITKTGSPKQFLELSSGGDTSYPGLVLSGDTLWVSYYSSHEGKSMIYLASVPITILADK